MTTIDRPVRPARRGALLTVTEWRLVIAAALAGVYVLGWRAIAASSPSPEPAPAPAPVAVRAAAPRAPSPRLVRVTPRRRVRTRSS